MIRISTQNKTTTPLSAGATYTGTGEDVSQYSTIRVILRSDFSSPGTLYVGFSPDGVSWTETSTVVSNPSTQIPIFVSAQQTYFRLRYVNGGVAQTTFRMQAELISDDLLEGAGVVSGSASVNVARQVFTLSPAHIAAKSITIATPTVNPATVDFFPYGGPKQRFGTDYTVSGTSISWNGLGLDGVLEANDVVEITYYT